MWTRYWLNQTQFAHYKNALRTLERKYRRPSAVVRAYLDKLSTVPPLKFHNRDNIINYSAAIWSLVIIFKSLSFNVGLKSSSPLNQAVQKIPPNMKQSWLLVTVKNSNGLEGLCFYSTNG